MVATLSDTPRSRSGPSELDRSTLSRCKLGDPLAFRAFVVHYQRAVFALVSRIVGTGGDVEDLAQEAFLRAHHAFATFDLDAAARPSAWILTIATRLAIDARRRRVVALSSAPAASDRPVDSVTPETEHARRELGLAIAAAGAELSADQRAAFILAEFHDLTTAEIAAALGIPENTVKTRLFRARQHMRQRLEPVRREAADGEE